MYVLDIHKAVNSLRQEKSAESLDYGEAADKTDHLLFDRFYKIMTAKTAEDLKGVSPEKIMELFPYVTEYSRFFNPEHSFVADCPTMFHQQKGVRIRRVL